MRTLLQISDPHFGTEQQPVIEALLALSQSVRPDVVVVSGDITQRARRSQFTAARAFLQQLGVAQVLAIPGNHDIPLFNVLARLLRPYKNYSRAFGANLEPSFEDGNALIICVNTTRPSRHKDGEVSGEQIDSVSQRLRRAATSQLRIVVTHQPVHVIDEHDLPNLLHGHMQAVRAWNDAGADIIMGGHIHLPHVRPLSERFTHLQRRMWSIQGGTAVSHRVRDNVPNSVNIVKPDGETCLVERWDYSEATGEFALHDNHVLHLER